MLKDAAKAERGSQSRGTKGVDMVFSSRVIEVVDVTTDNVAVDMSYKLELEGIPKPQARPRLGKCGLLAMISSLFCRSSYPLTIGC